MATSSQTNAFPLLFPAPAWLFFVETLPLLERNPRAIEDMVTLSLESHAPLPLEHLAYGWRMDANTGTVLYYAGARERLRSLSNGLYEKAGQMIPDFVLAPPGRENTWEWIATPHAVTALRRQQRETQPQEVRSWPIPEGGDWKQRAGAEREARVAQLDGEHGAELWLWEADEARRKGKNLQAVWKCFRTKKSATVILSDEAAWNADVRERGWLRATRKIRRQTILFNRLLVAGAGCCLAVLCLGGWLWAYHRGVAAETARLAARQTEVDAVLGKSELVSRLDEMEAGRVSFYDAMATLNHYRPTDVLFTRAVLDTNRRIQVNGTGASIGQINTYIDTLRRDGSFAKVDTPRISTQNGQTTFNFQATIGDLRVSRSAPASAEEILEATTVQGAEESTAPRPIEITVEEDASSVPGRRVFRMGGNAQLTISSGDAPLGPPEGMPPPGMGPPPESAEETSNNTQ